MNDSRATPKAPVVKPAPKPPENLNGASKRKADYELSGQSLKTTKVEVPSSGLSSNTPVQKLATRTPPISTLVPRATIAKRPSLTLSKPAQAQPKQAGIATVPKDGAPRPSGHPQAAVATLPIKPPKKGSYAEIIARAAAAQTQTAAVGIIMHKAKEKLPIRKDGTPQKESAGANDKLGNGNKVAGRRDTKNIMGGKSVGQESLRRAEQFKMNGKPIRPTVAYQGTAKPKTEPSNQAPVKAKPQPTYRGTMKPSTASTLPERRNVTNMKVPERKTMKAAPKSRRDAYSDEEKEEDEEDGYEYNDEDFSDMEAGWDEVEEEDEMAERIAKKEDAFEMKMLEEIKRQKEERKRRETQMAARNRG